MADNIVGQLRTAAIMQKHEEVYCPDLLREAAAEIERLRARVAELEGATALWGGTEITYEWFDEIKEQP